MILEKITKGNFNLEFTKKTYKHENNLRYNIPKFRKGDVEDSSGTESSSDSESE